MATVDHLPFPVEPKSNTPCRSRDNRIVGWAPATEDAVEATCGPPRGLSSRGLASEISTPEELGASGKLETGTSGPETSGTAFGGECDGSIVIGSQLSTVSWVGDSGVLASELTTDGSLLCQSPTNPANRCVDPNYQCCNPRTNNQLGQIHFWPWGCVGPVQSVPTTPSSSLLSYLLVYLGRPWKVDHHSYKKGHSQIPFPLCHSCSQARQWRPRYKVLGLEKKCQCNQTAAQSHVSGTQEGSYGKLYGWWPRKASEVPFTPLEPK